MPADLVEQFVALHGHDTALLATTFEASTEAAVLTLRAVLGPS